MDTSLKTFRSKTETVEGVDCVIYDSNAVIRMLLFPRKEKGTTFRDLASDFTAFILRKARHTGCASQILLILDHCYDESIKTQARKNCGDSIDQAVEYNIVADGRVHVNKDMFSATYTIKQHLQESTLSICQAQLIFQ